MKRAILGISVCMGAVIWAQNGSGPAPQAQTTLAWAYPVNPPPSAWSAAARAR